MNLSLKLPAGRGPVAKAESLPRTRKAATRYPDAVLALGSRPKSDHEFGPSALDGDLLLAEGCPAACRAIGSALRHVVSVRAESHS